MIKKKHVTTYKVGYFPEKIEKNLKSIRHMS